LLAFHVVVNPDLSLRKVRSARDDNLKSGTMRQERRCFVYIMTNPSRMLYTGLTNSIRRRVREHKLKLTPGFAAKYNVTRLVYYESFVDVRNAIERERQIKAWTRAKRVALVGSINPKWDDLSREWDQPQTFRFTPRSA
jgi:putative endonuclease